MSKGKYIKEGILEGAEGVLFFVGIDSAIGSVGFFLVVEVV